MGGHTAEWPALTRRRVPGVCVVVFDDEALADEEEVDSDDGEAPAPKVPAPIEADVAIEIPIEVSQQERQGRGGMQQDSLQERACLCAALSSSPFRICGTVSALWMALSPVARVFSPFDIIFRISRVCFPSPAIRPRDRQDSRLALEGGRGDRPPQCR